MNLGNVRFLGVVAGAGLAALLSLSVPAQAQTGPVPVTNEFIEGEIRFTGEYGTVYTYLWDLVADNGFVAVCGIGYLREARMRGTIRGMARDAVLELENGARFPVDVSGFASARSVRDMGRGTANCVRSALPLSEARGSIALDFGRGTFLN